MYSYFSSYNKFYSEKDKDTKTEHFADIVQVQELTDSTIQSVYKKPTVLLCYAPWCSHCVHFKPQFEELAKMFGDDKSVSFSQLEASKWTMAASNFNIEFYPTVFFIKNNQTHTYNGTRSIPLIKSWIESMNK